MNMLSPERGTSCQLPYAVEHHEICVTAEDGSDLADAAARGAGRGGSRGVRMKTNTQLHRCEAHVQRTCSTQMSFYKYILSYLHVLLMNYTDLVRHQDPMAVAERRPPSAQALPSPPLTPSMAVTHALRLQGSTCMLHYACKQRARIPTGACLISPCSTALSRSPWPSCTSAGPTYRHAM